MFLGVLAPLSVVDFCLCLKDVPFDSLPTDLGLYVVNKTIDLPSTSSSDTDGDAVASDKAAAMNADSDGDEQQQQVQRKEAAQRQLEIVMKETATLRERLAEEQELRIKAEEELQLLHASHKQKEQQQIEEEEEEGTPEYNGTVYTTNAEGVVEEEAAEVTELSSSLPLMGKEMLRVSEGVLILRKENERLRGEVAKLKLQLEERASEIPLPDATTTPIATTALPLLLEEKEKELQRQYAELTEQNRREQTSLKNQHDEETRLLRELLQRADEKQNSMTQEIDSLRAALKEREEQLQRQYQQLSDVAKRLEVQQAEAQKLHEIKMLEISSELTALTKRETKEREKKRQHKRRIAELEQELAAADRAKAAASLAPSTRENTQSVSEDTPTNGPEKLEEQQLRLQLAETERQLLDQSTTVELISKTLEIKDEKLLELKAEVKRLLAENEVLQASLQAEKDSIRAEDWTVVEDRTEIENKDREMAQLREALQQQLKDKQDSIQQLEQSLQERSEEVKKLTTLLQSSVQESHELVAGLERKNHALENNLQETKGRLAQLTQQRLEEAAQHKAAEQKLKTTIEELESTVATQHEQATILKKLLNMQS
ncbi:FYVE and coiled-coil domain-containing protein 1, variant 2 [Balamuthia mandrillaris]